MTVLNFSLQFFLSLLFLVSFSIRHTCCGKALRQLHGFRWIIFGDLVNALRILHLHLMLLFVVEVVSAVLELLFQFVFDHIHSVLFSKLLWIFISIVPNGDIGEFTMATIWLSRFIITVTALFSLTPMVPRDTLVSMPSSIIQLRLGFKVQTHRLVHLIGGNGYSEGNQHTKLHIIGIIIII